MSDHVKTTYEERRRIVELLNDAMSAEYHSFVGYALNSNPYVDPAWERDLATLERIRDEENAAVKAILIHMGRYRAGPTLKAFREWKTDLNYLGLDYLVVRAAENAEREVARMADVSALLPDDIQMQATFRSLLAMKQSHRDDLAALAKVRGADRDARRAASRAVTDTPLPGAPKKAAPAAAGKPAPKSPGGPPLPPGMKPPGMPKPPGAPKPPGPPLPPGFKLPGGGAKPPGPPSPPKPPGPPAPPKKPSGPPLPPGFKPPGA